MNKANDMPAARVLGKFSDPETTAASIDVSAEIIKDWIEQAKARLN